jgi:hypothetical protein
MKNCFALLLIFTLLNTGHTFGQCNNYSVPYFEGFGGITTNSQLPTCWAVSNPTTCQTFTGTNGNYGAFYYSPAGQSYFYSPGFSLSSGVIYSVSCFYKVNPSNNSAWSNLSILLGVSQSSTGLQTLVTNSFPTAVSYSPLTGTFTVINSGIYYLAIGVTNSGSGTSPFLLWTDFSLNIPCSLNSPSVTVVATSTEVCAEETLTIVASGADNFTWSAGGSGSSVTITPIFAGNQLVTVTGTSTLTGCSSTAQQNIKVNPKPSVASFANPPIICRGKVTDLNAFGAISYTWNFGASIPQTTVNPTVTTQYSVTGFNQYGCWSGSSIEVTVNDLPTITVPDAPTFWCAYESLTLTPIGASTYTWIVGGQTYFGAPLQFITPGNTIFVLLTGTDGNGCVSTFSTNIQIEIDCLLGTHESITEQQKLFPNPGQSTFYMEGVPPGSSFFLSNAAGTALPVNIKNNGPGLSSFDLGTLPEGIYFLRVNGKTYRLLKTAN